MAVSSKASASRNTDRMLPVSEEAERGVLGSILLSPETVLDLAIEKGLTPEAFYVPAHRILYDTLLGMHREARGKIDLLTVTDRLRSQDRLEAIGGESFLEQLVESTPTAAHAEHYIAIVYDRYLLRRVIGCAEQVVEMCRGTDLDARELLGKVEQAFFEIGDEQRRPIVPWSELIKRAMEEIDQIFSQKKGVTGLPTGFEDLDNLLHGLQNGDMIVLAARPSMGKTSLALNIVEHLAVPGPYGDQQQLPVAVFSLEMSSHQLTRRMLCSVAEVPSHRLSGFVSAENHRHFVHAAARLMKAPIYLDDSGGLEVDELRARARRLKRKYGVVLFVVDYLQLLHCTRAARDGRQQEVAAISGSLKNMAKELNVPVLVLSQLSRAPEQRSETARPRLSDLRESGAIEQDADVVLMLRRPCKYEGDPEHEDRLLAYVEVAKHRNGPTGVVKLNFDEELTRFTSRKERADSENSAARVGGGE